MIRILRASKDDVAAVFDLDQTAWNASGDESTMYDAYTTWRAWVAHGVVIIARHGDDLIGASLAFLSTNGLFCLHKVVTHPDWQKPAIANRLLDATLAETDALETAVFTVQNKHREPTLALFHQHGFYPLTEKREDATHAELTDAVILTRPCPNKPPSSAEDYLASIYR